MWLNKIREAEAFERELSERAAATAVRNAALWRIVQLGLFGLAMFTGGLVAGLMLALLLTGGAR